MPAFCIGTLCTGTVLFACYLVFAGQLSVPELGAAVVSAALATAFLAALRRCRSHRLALRPASWPGFAARTLATVPLDTLRVGRVLLAALPGGSGGARGKLQRQPFRPGGDDPADAGRRALVTLGISLAPNGYVLDTAAAGELLIHRLQPVPAQPDRDWPV